MRGIPNDYLRRQAFIILVKQEIDEWFKEGDKMDEQLDGKPMWKSKAVWAAVITALVGAVQPISAAVGHPVVVPGWVVEILVGWGLYGIRSAVGTQSKLQ